MSHRIDDVVHPEFIPKRGHGDGIIGVVCMLPGISHVDIEIDGDYQSIVIVVYAAPMRGSLHLSNDPPARPPVQVPYTGDWVTLVQVIENMHERLVCRNLDHRQDRHHYPHRGPKYAPDIFTLQV